MKKGSHRSSELLFFVIGIALMALHYIMETIEQLRK